MVLDFDIGAFLGIQVNELEIRLIPSISAYLILCRGRLCITISIVPHSLGFAILACTYYKEKLSDHVDKSDLSHKYPILVMHWSSFSYLPLGEGTRELNLIHYSFSNSLNRVALSIIV